MTRVYRQNLIGRRFGRLLVTARIGRNDRGRIVWSCTCYCGKRTLVETRWLTSGNSESCGCLARDLTRLRSIKHGAARTPEHRIWVDMRNRCNNPRNKDYRYYGGRGIAVCQRWQIGDGVCGGFECFLSDMGRRPLGLTIERKDNERGYGPDNCIWASRAQQARNRRKAAA